MLQALHILGPLILLVAGEPAEAPSLTLQEALHLADRSNHDILAAGSRLSQVKVGVEQSWASLLPTLAAQGKYTHNYKGAALDLKQFTEPTTQLAQLLARQSQQNPALAQSLNEFGAGLAAQLPSPSVVTIQKQEQLDASLTLNVPLVVPAAWYTMRAAESSASAAQANFRTTRTAVLLSVAQAFYAALGSDEILVARVHATELAEHTVSNAATKFAAGTVKRTDVTQAELTKIRARQAVLEARNQRSQAYRNLATLVQLRTPFVAQPTDLVVPPDELNVLWARSRQDRPEFVAYGATLQAYDRQITAKKWLWAPSLSGFGQARVGNYAGFTGDDYAWYLGLQLDWALYDGGARQAQEHLTQAQLHEAQENLATEQDAVHDAVINAYDTLKTRLAGLETAEDAHKLATETLALARVEYDAGTATQLDVLQAQDSLVEAEVTLAQARFDLGLAHILLGQAAGTFPEDIL